MSDRIERIRAALAEHLDTEDIIIRDDGHKHIGHPGAATGLGHFHVTIRSPKFNGVGTLDRHRLVYEALGNLMQTDIHAMQIKALAVEESRVPDGRTSEQSGQG